MRFMLRLTALVLAVMLLCPAALAQEGFLVHSADWALDDVPLSVTLSADIGIIQPYSKDRSAMLKGMTDNLSLQLETGADEGRVTVLVGRTEALTLRYQGNNAQISTVPDTTFLTSGDPMGTLLGAQDALAPSLYGLRGDAETLLEDGWVLLSLITPTFDDYADRRSIKTSISNIGTARSCTDYTIPARDADKVSDLLMPLCPEGWLHDILSSLTFSGKQTLRVYRDANEVPLRMEYNGVCGPADDLRKVKLVWRIRRDDVAVRDEVSLTSPAKSGSNKNTLEFERVLQKNKKGQMALTGSFSYSVTLNKQTTTTTGEFNLINAAADGADNITGQFKVGQKLPGDSHYSYIAFKPDVTIAGTQESPVISGIVTVEGLSGKYVAEQADIRLNISAGSGCGWADTDKVVDLTGMSGEELTAFQTNLQALNTTALVRPLILLMETDADWFFRDMSEEDVQEIIDAAGTVPSE